VRDLAPRTGRFAYGALIAFLFVLYANPGNWFNGLQDVGFAKVAAALALVALGGSWLLYNRRLTVGGWPGLSLLALFALVGFSALWSYWPRATLETFTDGLKYLAIFLVVTNVIDSPRRLRGVVAAIAIATVVPAFGAIFSYLHGEHLVEGNRAGWIGVFGNPNDLAYFLVIGGAMALTARDGSRRRATRLFYLALLLPIGVAILLTQSRGGMIASGVVLLLWALRSVRRAPAIVGVALAVGCVLCLGPSDVFEHRMETSVAFGEDLSARGRIDAWRTGLEMARERPLTGVGAGAFMIAWPDFAPGDVGPVRTEHNTFIQLIGELGFPGLLLFLVALSAGILGVSRAARTQEYGCYARGLQCGLAGFAVCSLSGGLAFTWPVYLLLGASFATARLSRAAETVPIARPRLALVAAGAR
jgi:O-antigen ligase